MKHAKKIVTIYHGEFNPEKGCDDYTGRVYRNVSFYGGVDTEVSKDGLSAAAHAVMRIPGNIKVQISTGDLVVIGAHPTSGKRPDDLADLADYVYTVVGVTDNTGCHGAHTKVVME